MSWRAAGCLVAGIGVFLAVTLFGMSLALRGSEGCPPSLQWGAATYEPSGAPAAEPSFAESGDPVALGSTLIGLSTRVVYGPPGSRASPAADERPDRIALDCGDETFQTYAVSRVLTPSTDGSGSAP